MAINIGIVSGMAALAVVGGYFWNRERMWTLRDRKGHALCRVQEGWDEQEVAAHCGIRSGRGMQPKVLGLGRGFEVQACSAPGDVYGGKVVLYACDGRAASVEALPANGFLYYPPPN